MDNSCICTVLLFTYNHAPYFARAIESVLEQETSYQFEIHVFDDASTDGTSDIVRDYAEKYPDKVKAFIASENQGAQMNMWRAYRSVTTKYCAVLETDDYWCDKEKLQLQISALEQHPECSFSAHQTHHLFENDPYREHIAPELVTNSSFKKRNNFSLDDILSFPVSSGYMSHASSRVIRSSVLDLNDVQHKEAFLYDNCQFYYLLLKGRMHYLDRVMNISYATGAGACSGVHPLIRAERHISALQEFNKQTNNAIGTRILQEMRGYIDYSLALIAKNTGTSLNDHNIDGRSTVYFLGLFPIGIVYYIKNKRKYKICGIPILTVWKNDNKIRVKLFGLTVLKIKDTAN